MLIVLEVGGPLVVLDFIHILDFSESQFDTCNIMTFSKLLL